MLGEQSTPMLGVTSMLSIKFTDEFPLLLKCKHYLKSRVLLELRFVQAGFNQNISPKWSLLLARFRQTLRRLKSDIRHQPHSRNCKFSWSIPIPIWRWMRRREAVMENYEIMFEAKLITSIHATSHKTCELTHRYLLLTTPPSTQHTHTFYPLHLQHENPRTLSQPLQSSPPNTSEAASAPLSGDKDIRMRLHHLRRLYWPSKRREGHDRKGSCANSYNKSSQRSATSSGPTAQREEKGVEATLIYRSGRTRFLVPS